MRTVWCSWWCVPLLAAGCMALPVPDDQPVDEGRKNLEAIREILAKYPCRSCGLSRRESEPLQGDDAGLFDRRTAVSSTSSIEPAPAGYRSPLLLESGDRPMARGSSTAGGKVTIPLPWKPSVPAPIVPQEPFHPIPPYLNGMPAAPGSPSSLRCVPDFSGGQRCR